MANLNAFLDRRASQVTRWHHRPVRQEETVADHQLATAHIAHTALLLLEGAGYNISPMRWESLKYDVLMRTLYHDMPEILLGDIPHYSKTGALKAALDAAEREALPDLFTDIGGPAAETLREHTLPTIPGTMVEEVLEWADKMSALSFAHQEVLQGNTLFIPIRRDIAGLVMKLGVGCDWHDVLERAVPDLHRELLVIANGGVPEVTGG